ncbi:MAG: hypothetical protein ACP5O8_03825 [Candidatus Aenigmatarchaeota archaeon]
MDKKILVIFLAFIICLFLIFAVYFFGFFGKNYETEIQERTKEFLKDNPNADESYARDVALHDLAIERKDSILCGKIVTNWLKEDCLNYFKVNK